jgi:nitrate/nitrite transporter NarK
MGTVTITVVRITSRRYAPRLVMSGADWAMTETALEFDSPLWGRKAAAGIAAINSIGNLGGFFGPTLIGYAREATGSFTLGLMVSCATLLASTLFTLSLRRRAASYSATA